MIVRGREKFSLHDTGAKVDGVSLNGAVVERCWLGNADVIKIHEESFSFYVGKVPELLELQRQILTA